MGEIVVGGVHATQWGRSPVVMLHGGTPGGGAAAFAAQRPLGDRWQLWLPDRPGHGRTPAQGREDFERDAGLIAPLLAPSAVHLVGHSYGGVVAIYIAAKHPERVRSLTLIEPPAYWLAPDDPATVAMSAANRELMTDPPADRREALDRFFEIVGIRALPPARLPGSVPLPPRLAAVVDVLLAVRGPWEGDVPMADLASGGYPIQVLTSGQVAGFEGIAKALVTGANAIHVVVPGTEHAVQEAGDQVNPLLEEFWSAAEQATAAAAIATGTAFA